MVRFLRSCVKFYDKLAGISRLWSLVGEDQVRRRKKIDREKRRYVVEECSGNDRPRSVDPASEEVKFISEESIIHFAKSNEDESEEEHPNQ